MLFVNFCKTQYQTDAQGTKKNNLPGTRVTAKVRKQSGRVTVGTLSQTIAVDDRFSCQRLKTVIEDDCLASHLLNAP